jgi:hypothetical protein
MSTPIFIVFKHRQPVAAHLTEAGAQARASNRRSVMFSYWPTTTAGHVAVGDEVFVPMIGGSEACPSKDKVGGVWTSMDAAQLAASNYVDQHHLLEKPYFVQWNPLRVVQ